MSKVFEDRGGDRGFALARKQRQLPSVLIASEVKQILSHLEGRNHLIASLMYGSGLRVNECLRLRVQDVDLAHRSITVHDGKGRKDRKTLLAASALSGLELAITFATALLSSGTDIRTVQELPGHNDVSTTQVNTHVLGQHYAGTNSPLDRI
jgi:site-specific recombinase XerD